jgi:hypothetical protein
MDFLWPVEMSDQVLGWMARLVRMDAVRPQRLVVRHRAHARVAPFSPPLTVTAAVMWSPSPHDTHHIEVTTRRRCSSLLIALVVAFRLSSVPSDQQPLVMHAAHFSLGFSVPTPQPTPAREPRQPQNGQSASAGEL